MSDQAEPNTSSSEPNNNNTAAATTASPTSTTTTGSSSSSSSSASSSPESTTSCTTSTLSSDNTKDTTSSSSCSTSCSTTPTPITPASETSESAATATSSSGVSSSTTATTTQSTSSMPVPTSNSTPAPGSNAAPPPPATQANASTPIVTVPPVAMSQMTSYEVTQNGHMSPMAETMVSNGVIFDQTGASGQNGTYIMQTGPQMIPAGGVPIVTHGVPPPQPARPHRGAAPPPPPTGGGGGGGGSGGVGLHQPGSHRGHSPHRYSPNSGAPQSRGNSPQSQSGTAPSQHVVLVHINPGETFSVRVGDQIQHIQGPATVRMVSNNGPPLPMPMQVPPGHMVQQIVDENGILTHVILSPQPPGMAPAPPMTVGYYGGPNSAPQQIYSPYGPQYPYATHAQYPTHHTHHGPPPPTHIHHVAPPPHIHSTPPPPQCNNHAPHIHHQGPGGPGGPPPHNHHVDERTARQQRLQDRVRGRKDQLHFYSTHSGNSPRRPGKGKVNGIGRTDNDSSSSADGQELEEERRSIRAILSDMKLPKVSNVDARSAFIQLKPPECNSQEYVIQPTEFKYELLLSEKTGKYSLVYAGDAPEITLQDLKPAMEYRLKVCSILDDLKGEQTDPVTFKTKPCIPDQPQSPKLSTRTKTSLLLKWNAATDNGSKITSYSLEYDKGRGDMQFEEVFNGLQRQYKVTKLSASTGYTFRLAAVNGCGKSQYSDTVCFFTSGSVPSQPDPPMLSEQFVNALTISWIKRPNDDEFMLQMEDEVTGHGFLPVYNGPYLSHKIETLRRNTEYKFRLSASNEEGSSKWSEIMNYRTLPDRPSAPNKPQLKGKVHATSLRVTWDQPRDTGGSDISKYHLELGDSRGFELVYEGLDREYNCDRLSPGHEYRVRVSCKSVGGQSEWSDCLKVQTLAVCPGPCQSPKLQGKPKATTLHLRWNYPDNDGGATVTDYEVLMTLSDSSTQSVYRGHALDCVVAGLSPGRSYLYQVRASSKAGTGPWSEPLEVVSGAGVPDPPKSLAVNCKSPHVAMINWDEPVNNGATITEYRLEWQHRPDADFSQLYFGSVNSFEVRGLTPATMYTFRVQALNSAGAGPFSAATSCGTPPSSPGAVAHLRGTATADTIQLTWQEPHNNGSEIVAYNIDLGEKHLIFVGNVLEHVIEDLQPETTYKIRVQAVNSIGVGAFSAPVKILTRALPPNPPRLECISTTHNSLKLKWGDGKNPDHVQYGLEMRKENNSSFQIVYQGVLHSHKVNRLTELTEYHFRTFASNEAGEGPYSRLYTFKTTKAPPAAVRPPKVSEVSLDSCLVEWQACKPLGNDSIVYCLQLQNGHSREQEYKQIYKGPETSYRVKGLSSKTEYQVRVSAIRVCTDGNADLSGAYSPGVSFVTQAPKVAQTPTPTTSTLARIPETAQLTDHHWAIIILLGFACFAAIVAVLAQRVIAYTNDNTNQAGSSQ